MLSSGFLSLRQASNVAVRRSAAVNVQRRTFSAAVSLSVLKDLRSKSGAPMMECKKALEETNGDVSKAMDWLRKHGAAKVSSKLQGRDAMEGLIGLKVAEDGSSAALVRVASETDFASRSGAFSRLVEHIAGAAIVHPQNGPVSDEILMDTTVDSKTVREALEEAIIAIRENLSVSSATSYASEEGKWVGYVHGRVESSQVAGTAAALVHVAPEEDKKANVTDQLLQDVGKKLAMHVVAAKPVYLNPESVPEEAIEKEKDILRDQMKDSGKPADILERIIDGRMRKFYESVCLTEQAHMVEEGNPKVSKLLKGTGIQLKAFELNTIA